MATWKEEFSEEAQAWMWFAEFTRRIQCNIEYWLMRNPPGEDVEPLVYAKANITEADLYRGCE